MGRSQHPPRDTVRLRSGGLCEKCGVKLTKNVNGIPDGATARSIHHRQPRRCGGRDSVVNMVNLCIGCHKDIHADEKKASLEGWIILDFRYPGKVPFLSWRGWLLPDKEGGLSLLDFETGRLSVLLPAPARTTRRRRVATRHRHRARQPRRVARAA